MTGAFGYSGAAIARDLLASGRQVRTLTGHPGRAPAGTPIDVRPMDFSDAGALERDLAGVHTLYNTYWIRFPRGGATHDTAVANSRVLIDAAGPQSLPFKEMVTAIRAATGSRALVVPAPARAIPPLSQALGVVLRDTLLTSDEYHAMTAGLADSDAPPTGQVKLTDWIASHGDSLGRGYANEISRHYR